MTVREYLDNQKCCPLKLFKMGEGILNGYVDTMVAFCSNIGIDPNMLASIDSKKLYETVMETSIEAEFDHGVMLKLDITTEPTMLKLLELAKAPVEQ